MRLGLPLAAAFSALFIAAATPAWAGYGALAHDNATGKFGLSWDKQTQKEADAAAVKDCGEGACTIVFRTRSHQCGAIAKATAEKSTAWGAGRGNSKSAAELAAVTNCQKHTKGQCKLSTAGCNR
ncbi:MAG TPA: DUF4189 domain-containing protein [Stellaceae bacterium]|nr:DUF4189 domain-containing protein [Stellaceae bacterium]